jgi:hypothetical protein
LPEGGGLASLGTGSPAPRQPAFILSPHRRYPVLSQILAGAVALAHHIK